MMSVVLKELNYFNAEQVVLHFVCIALTKKVYKSFFLNKLNPPLKK